jgi:hypothetical protein
MKQAGKEVFIAYTKGPLILPNNSLQNLSQEVLWRHWGSIWVPQEHIYGIISYTTMGKTEY